MSTDLPVYLIHWHAPDWCRASVESIRSSTAVSTSITVLNNGGQLGLPEYARVVELHNNPGFAGAANVALDEFLTDGRAEYVFIGSHDVHLNPDALRLLVQELDNRPDVGVLAPSLDGAGIGRRVMVDGDFDERVSVSGTGLLLRKECVRQVGFFDERFHSYVEDVDYCLRARDAGWRVGALLTANGKQNGSANLGQAILNINANTIVLDFKRHQYASAGRRVLQMCRSMIGNLRRRNVREAGVYWRYVRLSLKRTLSLMYRRSERAR